MDNLKTTFKHDYEYYTKDGNIDPDLFSIKAEQIVKSFIVKDQNDRPTRNTPRLTQVRKFYNEVLNLQNSINMEIKQDSDKDKILSKWLPYIRMLSAKVSYSKSREKSNEPFENFIKTNSMRIKNYKDFEVFVKLFEAVIAYSAGNLPKN